MALLQVEVLEAVREEVEVGGGRVEIVVDADAETPEVGLQYSVEVTVDTGPDSPCCMRGAGPGRSSSEPPPH